MDCETIPEMKARHAKEIADLQGQIERLTLDLHHAEAARERAEKASDYWNRRAEEEYRRWQWAKEEAEVRYRQLEAQVKHLTDLWAQVDLSRPVVIEVKQANTP